MYRPRRRLRRKRKLQEQLSSALRAQHAYKLGPEVGKAKIVAAQAEVASLGQSNRLLESKLRAAERSIAYRTSLLATARDERDDLKTENMCVLLGPATVCTAAALRTLPAMCGVSGRNETQTGSRTTEVPDMCRGGDHW